MKIFSCNAAAPLPTGRRDVKDCLPLAWAKQCLKVKNCNINDWEPILKNAECMTASSKWSWVEAAKVASDRGKTRTVGDPPSLRAESVATEKLNTFNEAMTSFGLSVERFGPKKKEAFRDIDELCDRLHSCANDAPNSVLLVYPACETERPGFGIKINIDSSKIVDIFDSTFGLDRATDHLTFKCMLWKRLNRLKADIRKVHIFKVSEAVSPAKNVIKLEKNPCRNSKL